MSVSYQCYGAAQLTVGRWGKKLHEIFYSWKSATVPRTKPATFPEDKTGSKYKNEYQFENSEKNTWNKCVRECMRWNKMVWISPTNRIMITEPASLTDLTLSINPQCCNNTLWLIVHGSMAHLTLEKEGVWKRWNLSFVQLWGNKMNILPTF